MSQRLPGNRLISVVETLKQIADDLLPHDTENATTLQAHVDELSNIAERMASGPRLDPLTPAQSRVLTYIREYFTAHGIAPTRQEIALGLGFKSANAAQEHLKMLDKKGVLTLTGSGPREIRLNKRTTEQQT